MTCCQSLECVRSVRPLFEEPSTEQSMFSSPGTRSMRSSSCFPKPSVCNAGST